MKRNIIINFFVFIVTMSAIDSDIKRLISSYVDEDFYREKYSTQLEQTGLSPVDHYLEHGWQGDWESNTDPNPWFSTIVYQQLWEGRVNPLADWLIQPSSIAKETDPVVGVFCKKEEVPRVWLAIEEFLRRKEKTLKVVLLLQEEKFREVPLCFKPQKGRGLQVYKYSGREFSFYESSFLKFAESFNISENLSFAKVLHTQYVKGHLLTILEGYYHTQFNDKFRFVPTVLTMLSLEKEPLMEEKIFYGVAEKICSQVDRVFSQKLFLPNSILIPGFLQPHTRGVPGNKINDDFSVSNLLSLGAVKSIDAVPKLKVWNYRSRIELWERREEIAIPKKFYTARRRIPEDAFEGWEENQLPTNSKSHLMSSQFSIAIENCCQENYFTEKLLDCFISMVVPIYMGCSNITDYFNPKGMIIVNSVDEIIAACNALTPDTYQEMLPYLQENYERAKEFLTLCQRKVGEFIRERLYPDHPEDSLSPITSSLKQVFSYAPIQYSPMLKELLSEKIIERY